MHTFKDTTGRTWTLEATIATARRIRDLAEFDLLSPQIDKTIAALAADPVQLVDVLYAWCKPAADKLDVTDEQFGQALNGPTLDAAAEALLEELPDFFLNPALRKNLHRVVAKIGETDQAAGARLTAILTDEKLDQVIENHIAKAETELQARLVKELGPGELGPEEAGPPPTPGDPSTSLPASSASTPAP